MLGSLLPTFMVLQWLWLGQPQVAHFCHQGVLWFHKSELTAAAAKLEGNLSTAFAAAA